MSPLHQEFQSPLPHSSLPVPTARPRLSLGFSRQTRQATYELFTPNNSGQRLRPTYYRGCWHVVSRRFFYTYRHFRFFPSERGLQPEGRHPPRGIDASGFRTLCNIPHCCLPYESVPCLFLCVPGRSLRPFTTLRLCEPLPHHQTDRSLVHPSPINLSNPHHAAGAPYPVLATISRGYPEVKGRLLTCYSPVRH